MPDIELVCAKAAVANASMHPIETRIWEMRMKFTVVISRKLAAIVKQLFLSSLNICRVFL